MLSFSFTLVTVRSNSRIASSIVMENVTVIARMTMVTVIPTEILRFIQFSSPVQTKSIRTTLPSTDSRNTPASSRQPARRIRLRFCSFISPYGLL